MSKMHETSQQSGETADSNPSLSSLENPTQVGAGTGEAAGGTEQEKALFSEKYHPGTNSGGGTGPQTGVSGRGGEGQPPQGPRGTGGVTLPLSVRLSLSCDGGSLRPSLIDATGVTRWVGRWWGDEGQAQQEAMVARATIVRAYCEETLAIAGADVPAETARVAFDGMVNTRDRVLAAVLAVIRDHEGEWRRLGATGGLNRRTWEAALEMRDLYVADLIAAIGGAL